MLALGLGVALLLNCGAAWTAFEEVWVRTDRSVDNSSVETIIRDVIKPGMSDEEKAVSLFNYFRRNVFHHLNTTDSSDPIKLMNILGYTLCGTQAAVNVALCKAAGLDARVVCWPNGQHTFYEANFDGQWHAFDTFTNFYVYTSGDKKHIASMEELKANPALATAAVAEGRACPGFLMCGDSALEFTKGFRVLAREAGKSDYSPKRLSLFKGMEFSRTWNCKGKASPGSWHNDGPGPKHTCGGKDDQSIENFSQWEPYLVRKMKSTGRSYRHWGSGQAVYSPDLRAGDWQDSAIQAGNLKSGAEGEPALHPVEAGKESVWIFELKIPYYITEGTLYLDAYKKNAEDVMSVSVSADQGKNWADVLKLEDTGKKKAKLTLDPQIVRPIPGLMSYQVRIAMKAAKSAADVGLEKLYLNTVFQHNMMAVPPLLPGKNKVTIESKVVKDKLLSHFEVAYAYQEGPEWDSAPIKEKKWQVSTALAEFEAELPEYHKLKQHRMLSLTYRCGKLAWENVLDSFESNQPAPAAAPAGKTSKE
jgi:hypothetical protein